MGCGSSKFVFRYRNGDGALSAPFAIGVPGAASTKFALPTTKAIKELLAGVKRGRISDATGTHDWVIYIAAGPAGEAPLGDPRDSTNQTMCSEMAAKHGFEYVLYLHDDNAPDTADAAAAAEAKDSFASDERVSFRIDQQVAAEWPHHGYRPSHFGVFPGIVEYCTESGGKRVVRLGAATRAVQQMRQRCLAAGLWLDDSSFHDFMRTGERQVCVPASKVTKGFGAAEQYWVRRAAEEGTRKSFAVGDAVSVLDPSYGRYFEARVSAADDARQMFAVKWGTYYDASRKAQASVPLSAREVHSHFIEAGHDKAREVDKVATAKDEAEAEKDRQRAAERAAKQAAITAEIEAKKERTRAEFEAAHPGVEPRWWEGRSAVTSEWCTTAEWDAKYSAYEAERTRARVAWAEHKAEEDAAQAETTRRMAEVERSTAVAHASRIERDRRNFELKLKYGADAHKYMA